MMTWTTLNTLGANEWDTPEMVKARNACNAEVEAILQERQQIDAALQALTNSDVASLDFDEIEAKRNKFQRDSLYLLQRELKLRTTQLTPYLKSVREVAGKTHNEVKDHVPEITAKIAKALESIGYLKCGDRPSHGSWEPGMIERHPEKLKATNYQRVLLSALNEHSQSTANTEAATEIQKALSKALTQLVG